MFNGTVLFVPRSDAIRYAADHLRSIGIVVTDKCAPDVTHVLLPVPSFSGGDEYLAHLLSKLPDDLIISGGNLVSPFLLGHRTVDFLQDPFYLAENAAITAQCAVDILDAKFCSDISGNSALVIGWGRIGKCLSKLLTAKQVYVTVAVRKESDLAMLRALGYRAILISHAIDEIPRFDMIINTVPVMLFPDIKPKPDAVLLELASKPGMSGSSIIDGRGLPGKMAPKKSGKLIAETFIRLTI